MLVATDLHTVHTLLLRYVGQECKSVLVANIDEIKQVRRYVEHTDMFVPALNKSIVFIATRALHPCGEIPLAMVYKSFE